MVEIHLYGRLRRYADDPRPDRQSVVRLQPQRDETLRTLLMRLRIPTTEVYHVFLNGGLLFTHNSMAPWLGYQSAWQEYGPAALDAPVRSGDRVGLFADDMALLVV
jgi:hypothetical protein